MKGYGVSENIVVRIERLYDDSLVKFESDDMTTGWCKSDYRIRQGCPLPPLLLNIYVSELDEIISNCVHCIKCAVVGKDGSPEWKSQAVFLYADYVCLMASSDTIITYSNGML